MKDEDKTKKQLINELKELRGRIAEYEESVVFDELTGLHNIRYFLVLAEHEFTRAHRYKRPLSLMMLSLDRRTQINEVYGHAIVDKAQTTVAEYCRSNVRFVDILGHYGGEEFVLLLPEARLEAAKKMAERMRKYVAKTPIPTGRGPLDITVSIGIASIRRDTPNLIVLLERTDKAMNIAKREGGDSVEVG